MLSFLKINDGIWGFSSRHWYVMYVWKKCCSLGYSLPYCKEKSETHILRHHVQIYNKYINVNVLILLFIKATRQGIWEVHSVPLKELVKYFFTYSKLNYGRMSHLFLSESHWPWIEHVKYLTSWKCFVGINESKIAYKMIIVIF